MSTFRMRGRRRALLVVLAAVVVASGISFAVFSRGAHAAGAGPNACADAGAGPDCTVIYVSHYKAHGASVQFTQSDNNADCPTTTATNIWANESVQHGTTTPPTAGPEMGVQIYQADCYGNVTLNAWGTSTDVTFAAPGTNLQSASATATVSVSDSVSGATFDVSVNLTWKGIGDISHGVWNTHQQTPSSQLNSHQSGNERVAIVSGSVVSGTTDYASGSSALGYLSLNDSGELYITR